MKPIWTHPGSWFAVIALAILLALSSPKHNAAMGYLPSDVGRHLVRATPVHNLDDGRVLALVTFHRDQRTQADTWIEGLALHRSDDIRWVRMPVFQDPQDAQQRDAKEGRVRLQYSGRPDYAHLVPVFTDRSRFVQATGVQGTDQAVVLVITRDGEVLAREVGAYDEDKARLLRWTLAGDF
jgi:hypothetical protein